MSVEEALKLASHITHPVTIVAFALVFAFFAFRFTSNGKKPWIARALAIGIILLGIAPLAASTYLQSRGVYRVRVTVLGPDQSTVEDAEVRSSIGGESKIVQGGWEFDIPPQTRPADGKLMFFASEKDAFQTGSSTLVLDRDYFPTTTIQLSSDTSALIRGNVVDVHGRSVAGAKVSVLGYSDVDVTGEAGAFVLPAHAADGQIVQVRAEKGLLVGTLSAPAGSHPVQILLK